MFSVKLFMQKFCLAIAIKDAKIVAVVNGAFKQNIPCFTVSVLKFVVIKMTLVKVLGNQQGIT